MSSGAPVNSSLLSQALQQALQASGVSSLQVTCRQTLTFHYIYVVCLINAAENMRLISSVRVSQGRWQTQMQQLRDMGIQDENLALRALTATNGDLQAALEIIFAGGL